MLPIVARCRREGDKIEFAYGTKKVKKILIDQKVNLSARNQAVVIEKDDTILALLGYASSIHLPNPNDCDIVIELKETKNES
jgi:tRNA(Ile)-lysidine synthetase-like protein